MTTIYRADGSQELATPKNRKDFSLEELQKIVGGYTKAIYLADDKIMVVNQDGKVENLGLNVRATEIIRKNFDTKDWIVGDVLVCDSRYLK
jgi:hypothetical protein